MHFAPQSGWEGSPHHELALKPGRKRISLGQARWQMTFMSPIPFAQFAIMITIVPAMIIVPVMVAVMLFVTIGMAVPMITVVVAMVMITIGEGGVLPQTQKSC